MKIIRWSVEHPYAVIAFYLGITLLSILALIFLLPTRMMPYIQSPMIGIITMAPGMSPREIETYISKPIEERMVDINGVRFIRSTSQQEMSIVSLEFWYGWDMRKALFDVQTLMTVAQADLPYDRANLKPSWVLPIDPLNVPVLRLSLYGKGSDPVALREFADNEIVNRLKQVKGVQSIVPFGGLKRQAQVVIDRGKLSAYNLSILNIKDALDSANIDKAAGILTFLEHEGIVRVQSRAAFGTHLAGVVVGRSPEGRVIYLSDIARALDTYRERRSIYHSARRDSAGGSQPLSLSKEQLPEISDTIQVSVIQQPDASSPGVISAVMKEVRKIERDFPGISFKEDYNNSHFVEIIRNNTFEELLLGILLTGIVVLLFLGEWRGTLIALVTIPTSLGIALLLFLPVKMSLNSSTLIGLLLAIGRLVDDSIINLHSIQRHLKMGKSPKDASIDGSSEVRIPVIAATFMLSLALLPLTFSGGIVQNMFVSIVWPFIFALLASLLVSLTLTPLMAAYLYKPYTPEITDPVQKLLSPFLHFLERVESWYGAQLKWALDHRGISMAIAIAAIYLGISLFPYIGSEMMPLADTGQAYAVLEAWPGTSLAKTTQMTAQFEKILLKHPEIRKLSTEIGFEPGGTYFTGYGMGGVNISTAMITFSDKDERKKSIWETIDAVYREAMATIPGIRRLNIKEMGADLMASSQAPVQVIIYGPDLARLSWLAEEIRKRLESHPHLYQLSTSWSYTQPEYRILVDQRRAMEIGLTPREIAEQGYYALAGGLTAEFFNPSPIQASSQSIRKGTVLVRYGQKWRKNSSDLEQITVTTPEGAQVPLKSVASIVPSYGPSLIERDGLRRTISLLAFYRKGGPGSMALTMDMMMKGVMGVPFPPGYGMEQRGDMTQMMDSFSRLLRGLLLAIIFIYLSLVAQFRSLTQPFTMLMAIPLELAGVFGALLLAHQTFSTVSVLGIVILNGMDVTASILLIDLIMARVKEKEEMEKLSPHPGPTSAHVRESVLEACPIRLRPILMTAIITIAVLTPVALFPRTGMDAYAPLATVVIGGLSLSTFLTLLVIPVLYTIVDDATRMIRERILRP